MVSIIIPIYKAEKFIRRCIDSVLTQTYKDWELILVDDGSPDNSGRICDEYSQKDSRIRVFHKHNGGVSSARNIGLDEARGDRITFIDADDYVFKNYLEVLISSEADLVTCGFKGINKMSSTPKKGYYEGTSFRTNIPIFYNTKQTATPWAKLFKRSIIESNNLRFDQALKLTEDTVFVFHYLTGCSRGNYLSAVHAGAGADVYDIIGFKHRFFVMLNDNKAVAEIAQLFKRGYKLAVIAAVQAYAGLI